MAARSRAAVTSWTDCGRRGPPAVVPPTGAPPPIAAPGAPPAGAAPGAPPAGAAPPSAAPAGGPPPGAAPPADRGRGRSSADVLSAAAEAFSRMYGSAPEVA